MLKIKRRGDFSVMLDQLLEDDETLAPIIDERIKWFRRNPDDTRLDNHPLTKKLEGKCAFSVTDDIRIVYEWLGKTTVRFFAIGGYRKAYKRKSE